MIAAGIYFFLLTSALSFAGENKENLNGQQRLPVFSSKPSYHGLFDEELIGMKDLFRLLFQEKKKFLLLDARGKQSYDTLHLKGAKLPLGHDFYWQEDLFRRGIVKTVLDRDKELEKAMKRYPKDTAIVTYCNDDCHASAVLVLQLKRLGFTNVKAMIEGIQTWQKEGYPVASSVSG